MSTSLVGVHSDKCQRKSMSHHIIWVLVSSKWLQLITYHWQMLVCCLVTNPEVRRTGSSHLSVAAA